MKTYKVPKEQLTEGELQMVTERRDRFIPKCQAKASTLKCPRFLSLTCHLRIG